MRELHLSMDQYGALPITRVWEIFKYFKAAPPLHLLVRDFVGYQINGTEEAPSPLPAELADAPLNSNLPAAVRRDIEEMRKLHAS